MHFEFTPYSIPVSFAVVITVLLIVTALPRRRLPGIPGFILFAGAGAVWSLGYMLEITAVTYETTALFYKLTQSAVAWVPITSLYMVIDFCGVWRRSRRMLLFLLAVFPVITTLLIWTNDLHHFTYRQLNLLDMEFFTTIVPTAGPGFWLMTGYNYSLVLLAYTIMIRTYRSSTPERRRQILMIVVGTIIPVVANVLDVTGLNPFLPLRLTVFALVPAGLSGLWALSYRHLFDLSPLARAKLIEVIHNGVIVIDEEGRVSDLNPAARHMLQSALGAIHSVIGKPAAQALRGWPALADLLRLEASSSAQIALGEGEDARYFDAHVHLIADPDAPDRVGRLLMLHDITERRKMETALREREERFRMMIDVLPQPVVLTKLADNTVMYLNRNAAEMFELDQDTALGRKTPQFYAHPADRDEIFARLHEDGQVDDFEVELRRTGGSTFWAVISAAMSEFRGEQVLLVGLHDITERRQSEQQALDLALEREKIHIMENFIRDASHDFRTPISLLMTSAYLIGKLAQKTKSVIGAFDGGVEAVTADRRELALAEIDALMNRIMEKASTTEDNAKRLEKIVASMLRVTELEHKLRFEFTVSDINQFVGKMLAKVEDQFARKQIRWKVETSPTPLLVKLADWEMEQALRNILDNAMLFTPEEGLITVMIYPDAGRAVIAVSDSGIGIPEEDLPHIFGHFYRVDEARSTMTGGAGLGLGISKRIVEAHGGAIEVESVLGEGSTFRVFLPLATTEDLAAQRESAMIRPPSGVQ